jgi:hypothetical protein
MPFTMLDPASWTMIALSFIGAQVAHKAANGAIQTVWNEFSDRFLARFKSKPAADQPTDKSMQILEENTRIAESVTSVLETSSALRRARLVSSVLAGARILWVDDNPENNAWECGLLRMLRAHVVLVTRTDTALDCLRAESFDLVLSDISRGGVDDEGVRALPEIKAVAPKTPVAFYVGYMTGPVGPEGSAGITNDPEELLHLILDRLERSRV